MIQNELEEIRKYNVCMQKNRPEGLVRVYKGMKDYGVTRNQVYDNGGKVYSRVGKSGGCNTWRMSIRSQTGTLIYTHGAALGRDISDTEAFHPQGT